MVSGETIYLIPSSVPAGGSSIYFSIPDTRQSSSWRPRPRPRAASCPLSVGSEVDSWSLIPYGQSASQQEKIWQKTMDLDEGFAEASLFALRQNFLILFVDKQRRGSANLFNLQNHSCEHEWLPRSVSYFGLHVTFFCLHPGLLHPRQKPPSQLPSHPGTPLLD